jgi:hypothetical protein
MKLSKRIRDLVRANLASPRNSAPPRLCAFALNLKDFNPRYKHNKGKLSSLALVVFRVKSG